MRVISLSGASAVTDQDTGTEHVAGEDGVFELPEPFAVHLTTKHASLWRAESGHEAALAAAKVDELRNPHVLPGVVADLRDRLAKAEERIAALEGAKEEAKAPRARKSAATKPE